MVKQLPRCSQIIGVAWAPPCTLRTHLQMPKATYLPANLHQWYYWWWWWWLFLLLLTKRAYLANERQRASTSALYWWLTGSLKRNGQQLPSFLKWDFSKDGANSETSLTLQGLWQCLDFRGFGNVQTSGAFANVWRPSELLHRLRDEGGRDSTWVAIRGVFATKHLATPWIIVCKRDLTISK